MYQIWRINDIPCENVDEFWESVKNSDMTDEHLEYVGEFAKKKFVDVFMCDFGREVGNIECRRNPCARCELKGTKDCDPSEYDCHECFRDSCVGCPSSQITYYNPYKIKET